MQCQKPSSQIPLALMQESRSQDAEEKGSIFQSPEVTFPLLHSLWQWLSVTFYGPQRDCIQLSTLLKGVTSTMSSGKTVQLEGRRGECLKGILLPLPVPSQERPEISKNDESTVYILAFKYGIT